MTGKFKTAEQKRIFYSQTRNTLIKNKEIRRRERIKGFEFIGDKDSSDNQNLDKIKHFCNICGGPQKIMIKDFNKKGNLRDRTITVGCLGHEVAPWFWNMHPEYDKFRKTLAKQHRASGV